MLHFFFIYKSFSLYIFHFLFCPLLILYKLLTLLFVSLSCLFYEYFPFFSKFFAFPFLLSHSSFSSLKIFVQLIPNFPFLFLFSTCFTILSSSKSNISLSSLNVSQPFHLLLLHLLISSTPSSTYLFKHYFAGPTSPHLSYSPLCS